jgi:hypothetical protein
VNFNSFLSYCFYRDIEFTMRDHVVESNKFSKIKNRILEFTNIRFLLNIKKGFDDQET